MKKMRKIFAVLLTLAMVLTMSMTAFATSNANAGNDNIFGTVDDTATITVTGIDNETGIQVNAYCMEFFTLTT